MINTGENCSIKIISSEKQEYEVSLDNVKYFLMLAAKPGFKQFLTWLSAMTHFNKIT